LLALEPQRLGKFLAFTVAIDCQDSLGGFCVKIHAENEVSSVHYKNDFLTFLNARLPVAVLPLPTCPLGSLSCGLPLIHPAALMVRNACIHCLEALLLSRRKSISLQTNGLPESQNILPLHMSPLRTTFRLPGAISVRKTLILP